MAPFTFRLDSVLKLRIAVEQSRQRDLAAAQVQLAAAEADAAKLQHESEAAAAGLHRRFGEAAVNARWLILHARHQQLLCHRRVTAAAELERLGRDLDRARAALAAASAQRKAIEKLRERHLAVGMAADEKRERAAFDEAAVRVTGAG